MPAAVGARAAALLLAAGLATGAGAVGLGPLAHSGVTNSERKGFYLTLINPYPGRERFRLYSAGWDGEAPAARVLIPVDEAALKGRSQRRLLVIATGLRPGEVHRFRVCAERVAPADEGIIHARVCSKLVARRLG